MSFQISHLTIGRKTQNLSVQIAVGCLIYILAIIIFRSKMDAELLSSLKVFIILFVSFDLIFIALKVRSELSSQSNAPDKHIIGADNIRILHNLSTCEDDFTFFEKSLDSEGRQIEEESVGA